MRRDESDAEAARRAELAGFLRARRASLQPGDVNLLPQPGRRNTPGLRREEVAQVSGVGVTWYTWLEQGRDITLSDHVIDALARALRLDRETHKYLRYLADLPVPEPDQLPSETTPELLRLLDALTPTPASIFGPRFDYVAWNPVHARLWHIDEHDQDQRNLVWLTFMDLRRRKMILEWERLARYVVARFRAAAGQHAGDPRFTELIDSLNNSSEPFRSMWSDYAVRESIAGPLTVKHPQAGAIHLDVTELRVSAHPSLTVSVQVPHKAADRRKIETLLHTTPPAAPPDGL